MRITPYMVVYIVLCGIWIYYDSKNRNITGRWATASLIFHPIVVPWYFLKTRKTGAWKPIGLWILGFVIVSSIWGFYSGFVTGDKKVISEKDAEYMIKGIDIDSGKIEPGTPQTETQTILANMMQESNQLNIDMNNKIAKIGPFEFSSFVELKGKNNVLDRRKNLEEYWKIKKAYYDSLDILLKKYREKLNYGEKYKGRLAGTGAQFLEKLEKAYVDDLDKFYGFILQYHEKMIFAEEEVLIEDDNLVDEFNSLWNKAVKSATDLTTAQKTGSEMIRERVKEWQKEI
jgi:hypothetical protein